ncbi:hypothetical protein K6119_05310 [Paracrocinitomix mangrovi]|uniref:hypothetical protein n=1 Tax=Paracrocinitomix mangrovi TaxID=2862509 RepID=UPI001C8E0687|nr:hypothetical protein [Paracrocinitomix mangrovi]UKN02931.1 hypothetical protein K6119_05310 [Paracrocinitomix mangrovi]
MKPKALLILIFTYVGFAYGQMKFDKCLKKLGLTKESVVYTDENVILFPRGFVYNLSDKDSLTYLGCLSSDQEDFENAIENTSHKQNIGRKIIRQGYGVNDTIAVESWEQKVKHFKYADKSISFMIEKDVKFVLVYYWSKDVLDRSILKNYYFFIKYAEEHLDLKIKVLPVCTDPVVNS